MSSCRLYNNPWDGNGLVLCCHIPKAMGSWLRKELVFSMGPERNFKPIATLIGKKEIDDPVWSSIIRSADKYSLIEGHFHFDERAKKISEQAFSICCVREPFEIFWSHIKYIAKIKDYNQLSLMATAERYIFDNPLCRYLSGVGDVHRLLTEEELDTCVEKAKKNILYFFDFIFIDRYLSQCCRYFSDYSGGMSLSSSEKANASSAPEWYFDIDVFRDVCYEKYEKYYYHDKMVYEYVERLFLSKASDYTDGLLRGLLD